MPITLEAWNYRGLRRTTWSPSGVCVLVGPNGSGKTTLLSVFEFLRTAWREGLPSAVDAHGGAWGFRHFSAPPDEAVSLGVSVADWGWELRPRVLGASADPRSPERVIRQGTELSVRRESYGVTFGGATYSPAIFSGSEPRLLFPGLYDLGAAPDFAPLAKAINSFQFHRDYNLSALRENGSRHGSDLVLTRRGENAFTVLRNWHGSRDHRPKYEFVLQGLRSAFPEVCQDMDFESAGQTNSVRTFLPRSDVGVPVFFSPNGWITALLHLCAVAGAEPGSLIAIDEVENSLHPYAIRQLMDAFREWAGEHNLTVCLATHSPVVLDEFKEEPENVFVMEPGQEQKPVALDKLCDPEWLRQFSLGRLYAHGDFGGQRGDPAPAPAR